VPPVAGKVLELKVGLGDHVKKGQLLLVMTSGDFAQAASDQQKARNALQLAKKVLERQRGVQDAGAGAAKDLEQAESTYIQAQAEFSRADTRLKSLGAISADSSGRRLNIVAPTSGSITALSIGVGQSANDPNAVLMTIANLDQVWITANVPEAMLASVRQGQPVSIHLPAYPGTGFQGNVAFVSDVLQADTRRAPVRISMPNAEGKFKPNMFATASFAVAQASAPVVPTSALLMNNDDTTVFVEVAPWTFVRRKVEIGNEEDGRARIQTGLNAGERVVTTGGVLLND
jgi:cobalt-zinc-cadmium efflux system membrane fusion protein